MDLSLIWINATKAAALEGVAKRTIQRRVRCSKYVARECVDGSFEIALHSLSEAAQRNYMKYEFSDGNGNGSATVLDNLNDNQLQRAAHIRKMVQEALAVPPQASKLKHKQRIAKKYGISYRQLQRYIKESRGGYDMTGMVRKQRSDKGRLRATDDEAMQILKSIYISPRNKHITFRECYERALNECQTKGLNMASYEAICRWRQKYWPDAYETYKKDPDWALENVLLPPVIRDRADCEPNQVWTGDQHVFNWFVVDPATGDIFRPQGYLFTDWRTNAWVGFAMSRKYNSWIISLALRDGIIKRIDREIYGKPSILYTDNGRPELSNFLSAGLDYNDIKIFKKTNDSLAVREDLDEEGLYRELGATRKLAIPYNAKAKPIERAFKELEIRLLNRGDLIGYAGSRVGTMPESDQQELRRLLKKEYTKLLTPREFLNVVLETMEHHNAAPSRARGLRGRSPNEVWQQFLESGFRPESLDMATANVLFLMPTSRKVQKATITVDKMTYTAPELVKYTGQRLNIRYDPTDPSKILVFRERDFICEAKMQEMGSMVNAELTARLNAEKRRAARHFKRELQIWAAAPDDYSSSADKPVRTKFDEAAKALGKKKQRKTAQRKEATNSWEFLDKRKVAVN